MNLEINEFYSNISSSTPFPALLEYSENGGLQFNESLFLDTNNLSVKKSYANDSGILVRNEDSAVFMTNSSMKYLGLGIPNTPFANKVLHYCFGVMLTVIGIAGATGNGLVLYVFTRYRRLRGGGVPLVLSLAAGDFIVSLLHIMPAYSSFRETWSFGQIGCELYAASVGLCGLASLLTLSVIAAERFCVIMGSPITWLSSKKACAAIWVASFGLVFPPFVGWSKYITEGMGTSCSWDYTSRDFKNRVYYIFLLTFGFFLPVSVIIISYLGILHVVCTHSSRMNDYSRNGGLCKKGPSKTELKTAQVVLSIIVCFLVAWTPYAICSMIGQFGNASLLSPVTTSLPAIFAKSSVVYNPFVYGLSHPLFRTAFAALKAQYVGKRKSDISFNPHHNQRCHRHPCRYNKGDHVPANSNRKAQLVVMAGNGPNGQYTSTTSSPYNPHNRRHPHPEGQKVLQFDGFRGKIPRHLLRHFTHVPDPNGINNSGERNRQDNSGTQQTTTTKPNSKDITTEHGVTLSITSPCTSFRAHRNYKENVENLKKGVWVFKNPVGPPSDTDDTARTGLATGIDSNNDINSDETDMEGGVPKKSDHLAGEKMEDHHQRNEIPCNYKGSQGGKFIKNSYAFFLCEFRKRRQENIQKRFFRSENCLINNSYMKEEGNKLKSVAATAAAAGVSGQREEKKDVEEWELAKITNKLKQRRQTETDEKIRELHKSFLATSNDKLLHEFYSYKEDQLLEEIEAKTLFHVKNINSSNTDNHDHETIKGVFKVNDLEEEEDIPIPRSDGNLVERVNTSRKSRKKSFDPTVPISNRNSWGGFCCNGEIPEIKESPFLGASAVVYPLNSQSKAKKKHVSVSSKMLRTKSKAKIKHLLGSNPFLKLCLSTNDMEKVREIVTCSNKPDYMEGITEIETNFLQKKQQLQPLKTSISFAEGFLESLSTDQSFISLPDTDSDGDCCQYCDCDMGSSNLQFIQNDEILPFQEIGDKKGQDCYVKTNLPRKSYTSLSLYQDAEKGRGEIKENFISNRNFNNNFSHSLLRQYESLSMMRKCCNCGDENDIDSSPCSESCYESCKSDLHSPSSLEDE